MKNFKNVLEENELIVEDSQIYEDVIKRLQEARDNNVPVNEGILGGILGGIAGATIGPSVMKAVCNALGVSLEGHLGKLLTSKLVLGAVGAKIGW